MNENIPSDYEDNGYFYNYRVYLTWEKIPKNIDDCNSVKGRIFELTSDVLKNNDWQFVKSILENERIPVELKNMAIKFSELVLMARDDMEKDKGSE